MIQENIELKNWKDNNHSTPYQNNQSLAQRQLDDREPIKKSVKLDKA